MSSTAKTRRGDNFRPMLKAPADPELFSAARARAEARGIDMAKLVREAVRRELEQPIAASPLSAPLRCGSRLVEPDPARSTDKRYSIRLPEYVADAAHERAKAAGIKAVSRWITALAQSNVSTSPVLTEREIAALLANARALSAIGRNINQIAHSLNEARLQVEPVTRDRIAILSPTVMAQMEQFKNQIVATRDNISALIRASRNAWAAE